MTTNLFKGLKPSPKRGHSGFDLSQKHVFSLKPGEIRPVMCLETVPDDYFEIDAVGLTRTMTMNTAAFIRGKLHYDFFFVPYSQLWHPFNQFITQRTDAHSSNQRGTAFTPVISLGDFLKALWNNADSSTYKDIFGKNWFYGATILLDMLGYGDFHDLQSIAGTLDQLNNYIATFELDKKYVNIFRLAAYQHIWYDFYRNKYFDVEGQISETTNFRQYVEMFNYDDIQCRDFATSIIPVTGAENLRRICNLTTLRYRQWKKDIFTSAMPSTQFGAVSSVQIGNYNDLVNNLDHTHNNVLDLPTNSTDEFEFPPRSVANLGDTDVVVTPVNPDSPNNKVYLRSGVYGDDPQHLSHFHVLEDSFYSDSPEWSGSFSNWTAFDVLSLRRAEMLQAWKQAALRAGNMTDDSMRAHYGVDPYYNSDENVNYLGSFSANLDIDPVAATAAQTSATINGRVGELASNGSLMVQGKKIKCKLRDFGVIMCIASYVPDAEYSSFMCDKANTLFEPFDFFTPEFENIGLEPLTISEYNLTPPSDLGSNHVLGYVPRYHQYKTAIDKVHGEFNGYLNGHASGQHHSLIAWVAPRVEQFTSLYSAENSGRHISTFYINPDVYNNVMAVAANSNQRTDVFLNNVFFDVKAIRPMSVLGLPQF